MSAFNAKNLEYNRQEPSFLRKLKAEHGGDRSNVQFARPKKDRLKTGDGDEDEPTIVDEHGESLGRGEWEEMLKKVKEGAMEGKGEQGEVNGSGGKREDLQQDSSRGKQQVAEIGTSRKRKAVKVVADETATEEGKNDEPKSKVTQDKPAASTTKKKTKKVKLSFDNPNDG